MKQSFEEQIRVFLFSPGMLKIIAVIAGTAIIWILIKIIRRNFLNRIKDNDNRYRTKKFVGFFGYFLTLFLITIIYSDKLGGLSIALGVAGAGIAFALQEVIVSFAGWLAILFTGLYKPGDRIQLGGIRGDVMDIGMLRTTLMETGQWVDGDLYNGRIVFIANSFVFKEPVYNYSIDFPFLWDEIKIPVKFGSDYELAKSILIETGREIAGDVSDQSIEDWRGLQRKYRLEEARTDPMVSLVATDNWVEYTLRYIVNYKKRRTTRNDLFIRILKRIDASNGKVMFASATFDIVGFPEININNQQGN
ncbi:MAG: mechanosensitive ion channel family protein [Bacteroidales bacterium]|nr:mechanosensitive ion channel family protein [Bacteroidales bacterium]